MRFTRRLRDMDLAKLLVLAVPASLAVAAGCSSSDDESPAAPPPAPLDASTDAGPSVEDDAGVPPPTRDAGFVDVDPLPIECASPPCATALVTTSLPVSAADPGQGFCALLSDRTVACWGANASGQLGRGEPQGTIGASETPARVVGLERVVSLDHTCALDEDGATWCWGTGPFLQDQQFWGHTTERTPVRLALPAATHVGIGASVGCVATSDGRVLCWGAGDNGQVGLVSSVNHGPTVLEVPPGPPIRRIAIGAATFLVREDGSVLSLGNSMAIGRVSSLLRDPFPVPMDLEGVRSLDIALANTCAAARGIGYCWGSKLPSALDNWSRAYPRGLVIPEPVVDVATTPTLSSLGGVSVPYRWCAVAASGTVYCWGANQNGQAGTGTKEHVNDAARVVGLPAPAVSVKTTPSTTCALLTTGKVYCWGGNYDGQLGNGKVRGLALVPEEVILP